MPGLNLILRRMLTSRAARLCDAAAASEAMTWVAREPDAYLCLAVLQERVVPALRSLFLQHWEKQAGTPWEDTPEHGQRYMQEEVKRNRRAAKWLIRDRLARGDSAAWDTTELCAILLWSQVSPRGLTVKSHVGRSLRRGGRSVCVRACACVRACVRVCVCVVLSVSRAA